MKRLTATVAIAFVLVACGRDAEGTVRGVVLLGPTCPVERAGSPCPGRPLAHVTVTASDGAAALTDADGRFTLRLAPGDYTVRAEVPSVPAGGSEPVAVHVERDRTVSITVPVDSGIR